METNIQTIDILPEKEPFFGLINQRQEKILPLLGNDNKMYEKLLRSYVFELYAKEEFKNCNQKSIVDGFIKCCELKLDPSVALGKIYMINHGGTLNLQVGYQGWLELLWRSPLVTNVYANQVYEGDDFEVRYGVDTEYYHVPKFMSEELRFTYAVVKFKSGDIQLQIAKKKEIMESKAASKGSQSVHSPWNKYFDSMAKIVPMRKIAKNLALAIRCDDEFVNEESEKKLVAKEVPETVRNSPQVLDI